METFWKNNQFIYANKQFDYDEDYAFIPCMKYDGVDDSLIVGVRKINKTAKQINKYYRSEGYIIEGYLFVDSFGLRQNVSVALGGDKGTTENCKTHFAKKIKFQSWSDGPETFKSLYLFKDLPFICEYYIGYKRIPKLYFESFI